MDVDNLELACPFGELLTGPPMGGPSVICKAARDEARRADSLVEGETQGVHLTVWADPSTVLGLCCGTDDPLLGPDVPIPPGRKTYTACPIFREEWERARAHKARLFNRLDSPDPNSIYPFHRPPANGGIRSAEDALETADPVKRAAEVVHMAEETERASAS